MDTLGKFSYKGFDVEIRQDYSSMSPITDWDVNGIWLNTLRNSRAHNDNHGKTLYEDGYVFDCREEIQEFRDEMKYLLKENVLFLVNYNNHTGAHTFAGMIDKVSEVIETREDEYKGEKYKTVMVNFGADFLVCLPKELHNFKGRGAYDKKVSIAKAITEEVSLWAQGNVFFFTITENGELFEDCGGYIEEYGGWLEFNAEEPNMHEKDSHMMQDIRSIIDNECERREKQRQHRLKEMMKNDAPLQARVAFAS